MTAGDEGHSHETGSLTREELIYAASSMPYLVSVCSSVEEAKDLACRLIDSGLPVMVEQLDGLPEGSCWLVFTDRSNRDIRNQGQGNMSEKH
jgi:hypothetical protein